MSETTIQESTNADEIGGRTSVEAAFAVERVLSVTFHFDRRIADWIEHGFRSQRCHQGLFVAIAFLLDPDVALVSSSIRLADIVEI